MKVTTVGAVARQVLNQQGTAQVLGVTSGGIFLLVDQDRVLYLSAAPYRGPLTLNLQASSDRLLAQAGDPVIIQDGTLWFPKSRLHLPFIGAETWSTPPAGSVLLPTAERFARLEKVSRRVPAPGDLLAPDLEDRLSQALHAGEVKRIVNLLQPLLGRGPGLTPAGDDLVLGLLLALNRWGHVLAPGFPVGTLNPLLVREARARTITLSANLIACAAQGQADERLVRGLDGLVTGEADVPACARCFMEWGSTSGASAFEGMKLVAAPHLGT